MRQGLVDHVEGTGLYPKNMWDTVEGFRGEHHGIICLLEDSLWLLFADWTGEKRGYCLLVSSASSSHPTEGLQGRCPSLEVSVTALHCGSPPHPQSPPFLAIVGDKEKFLWLVQGHTPKRPAYAILTSDMSAKQPPPGWLWDARSLFTRWDERGEG